MNVIVGPAHIVVLSLEQEGFGWPYTARSSLLGRRVLRADSGHALQEVAYFLERTMTLEFVEFKRDELYAAVWTDPVTTVSKRYGLSDVGLRKICLALEIPVPPLGFWAKRAAGKKVVEPPLKPTRGPTVYRHSRRVEQLDKALELRVQVALAKDSNGRQSALPDVQMRASLDECLPLVKRIAKQLNRKSSDARAWPSCKGPALMSMSVSPEHWLRGVLLLNFLLESLKADGHELCIDRDDTGPAYVAVLGLPLTFKVKERSEKALIALTAAQEQENMKLGRAFHQPTHDYVATGNLEIVAASPKHAYELLRLSDKRNARLETEIAAFVLRIRELALRRRVQAELNHERQLMAEVEAQKRQQLAALRQRELGRLERVEDDALRLERARRLRRYARALESRGSNSALTKDISWIKKAADWLDPIVSRHWEEVDGPLPNA
jgi:hypothetical protein